MSQVFVSFSHPWYMNVYERCNRGEKNKAKNRMKKKNQRGNLKCELGKEEIRNE